MIEWAPIAGLIALLVRSRRAFLLVGAWFAVYVVLKATYIPASVEDASFWRILMPAFPAFVVLAAAIVLALPGVRARPAAPLRGDFRQALAVAVVVFAALPLGAIAAMPQLHDQGQDAVHLENTFIPVSSSVHVRATWSGGAVHLRWHGGNAHTGSAFYRVLRTGGTNGGVACAGRRNGSSDNCTLFMNTVGTTRATSFVDKRGPGRWTYRIGVSANWLDDPTLGDVYVVSRPVTVPVP